MTEMLKCGECLYWEGPQGDDDMGCCHRFPPVLIPGNTSRDDDFEFPYVHECEWCGEFKERNRRKGVNKDGGLL